MHQCLCRAGLFAVTTQPHKICICAGTSPVCLLSRCTEASPAFLCICPLVFLSGTRRWCAGWPLLRIHSTRRAHVAKVRQRPCGNCGQPDGGGRPVWCVPIWGYDLQDPTTHDHGNHPAQAMHFELKSAPMGCRILPPSRVCLPLVHHNTHTWRIACLAPVSQPSARNRHRDRYCPDTWPRGSSAAVTCQAVL